jgi:hypothetical protein
MIRSWYSLEEKTNNLKAASFLDVTNQQKLNLIFFPYETIMLEIPLSERTEQSPRGKNKTDKRNGFL